MFCRNCGNPVDPYAVVCTRCGVQKGMGFNFCYNCGRPVNPAAAVCVSCGVALNGGGQNALPGSKSRLTAGLFGLFLGGFGVHRFYLGYTGIGIAQIAVTIVTFGVGALWGFIEGILILCKSGITKDANGNALQD